MFEINRQVGGVVKLQRITGQAERACRSILEFHELRRLVVLGLVVIDLVDDKRRIVKGERPRTDKEKNQ